jgi:hypothetical protein
MVRIRIILVFLMLAGSCRSLRADVIVLANRSGGLVPLRFIPASGAAQQLTLPADETLPLFLDGKADVSFSVKGFTKQYTLDANCAYFFGRNPNGPIDLQKIGLGEDGTATEGRKLPESAGRALSITIPVKVLVDEEEPARPQIWERRLRSRVEAASAIFDKYFHVSFRVVAVGTWQTDNSITDFFDSLSEFEHKVDPAPAKIAIGFTSQWKMVHGRIHMAGTRGPLHSHILVREGSPEIGQLERLEFLVHELGHYLGAAHSPEPQSVMRPVLSNRPPASVNSRIQFDPVNALTMGMISEEVRRSGATKVSDLQFVTRQRLEQIYRELARALPTDPAGPHYASLMKTGETPLVVTAKQILQQITRAAVENHTLPASEIKGSKLPVRRQGDALTDYYVREAARASVGLPEDVARQAFLLALAIGLDESTTLITMPGLNGLQAVEPASDRMVRMTAIGKPTVRGRSDLAQHFFIAAFLTAITGNQATQAAALESEFQKASRPGGFSFKTVAADRAGCRFGKSLMDKRFTLFMLESKFSVASFMPEVDSLPDGISAKDLTERFGKTNDPRFVDTLHEIDKSVLLLPIYRATGPNFGK